MHLRAKSSQTKFASKGGPCRTGEFFQTCAGWENHFRHEQRTPLAVGGVLFRPATDEFVATVEFDNQAGRAETVKLLVRKTSALAVGLLRLYARLNF